MTPTAIAQQTHPPPLDLAPTPSPPAARPIADSPPACADLAGSTAHDLVIVVAPGNGRFRPVVRHGAVEAGDVVARVETARSSRDVRVGGATTLRGLLALPGQLVVRGQALAWASAGEPSA